MSHEDDELIDQLDPSPAGRLTLDLETHALSYVLNAAARMVADRVWNDMHEVLEESTVAAMNKAVAERIEPVIAEIVSGVQIEGEGDAEACSLRDRITDAFKSWATASVDRDGKPVHGYSHSQYDKPMSRLQWFIKREVGAHMEKQATEAIRDLKDGARKIATDILAAAIQQRLPKSITGDVG